MLTNGLVNCIGKLYYKSVFSSNTIGYAQIQLVPTENARLIRQTPNGDFVGQMIGSTSSSRLVAETDGRAVARTGRRRAGYSGRSDQPSRAQ